jgi:adenylate cyclase
MVVERPILIVDDEEPVRSIIADFLSDCSFRVLQAESAERALALAKEFSIGAFLVDIQIQGRNGGLELCRTIRTMADYKVSPIIVTTGLQERGVLLEAFAAGCDDFINKPIDGVVLLARLKAQLQRMEYFEELERTRRMLNRYLSTRTREVAEASTRTGSLPSPEQREIVILFTDIRGFTALSEEMRPDQLFSLVSGQLADQVNLVYEHGGYIDKFGGDGVMAVFDKPDKVRQSCLCALRMIERAQNVSTAEDERIRQLGIGIHMGHAIIGNIGSAEHMDYSAIGTTVNLAARLCGHADRMSIVVSDTIRNSAAGDPRLNFHSERRVAIRGLKDAVTVYSLDERPLL